MKAFIKRQPDPEGLNWVERTLISRRLTEIRFVGRMRMGFWKGGRRKGAEGQNVKLEAQIKKIVFSPGDKQYDKVVWGDWGKKKSNLGSNITGDKGKNKMIEDENKVVIAHQNLTRGSLKRTLRGWRIMVAGIYVKVPNRDYMTNDGVTPKGKQPHQFLSTDSKAMLGGVAKRGGKRRIEGEKKTC